MSLAYSELNEVWGAPAEPVRRGKASKKAKKQSACHLYEQPVSAYDDIFAKYSNYERQDDSNYIVTPPTIDVFPDVSEPVAPKVEVVRESVDSRMLEFVAFAFAGVLLIFLMESLVQVGMKLRTPF